MKVPGDLGSEVDVLGLSEEGAVAAASDTAGVLLEYGGTTQTEANPIRAIIPAKLRPCGQKVGGSGSRQVFPDGDFP